jgi:hypothetical protein
MPQASSCDSGLKILCPGNSVENQCPGNFWTLVTKACYSSHVRKAQTFTGKQVEKIHTVCMNCVGRLSSSPQLDG